MEIRAAGPGQELQPVAVTMRTPGGDFELAVGFLFTEGLIGPGDVQRVAYCDNLPGEDQRYNVVSVHLRRPFDADRVRRNFYATSSCGICGKAALEDVEVRCGAGGLRAAGCRPRRSVRCPTGCGRGSTCLRPDGRAARSRVCSPPTGDRVSVREDVGRHNAVDKVIGEQLLAGNVPLSGNVLQVSGRLSFEIVQKAAVAGIPIVSAVSAPTSLAVEAGERLGMTVVGFVRDGRLNIYAGAERVA